MPCNLEREIKQSGGSKRMGSSNASYSSRESSVDVRTHLLRVLNLLIRLVCTGPGNGENVGSAGAGIVPDAPDDERLIAQSYRATEHVLAWENKDVEYESVNGGEGVWQR